MDQTAPADQSILRDQRERSEDANLDRRVRLCPRRHRPEASRAGRQPLPNSTDLERDAIRENAHFTGPSGLRLQRRFTRRQQPIDSIRLLAGQQCSHALYLRTSLVESPADPGGRTSLLPSTRLFRSHASSTQTAASCRPSVSFTAKYKPTSGTSVQSSKRVGAL